MNKGTVGTRLLERSIIKHIEKGSIHGVGPACDYSVLDACSSGISISSIGFADETLSLSGEQITRGELAYLRASNNMATSGGSAKNMLVTITASPDTEEQILRDEMNNLSALAHRENIRIAGGNTVYTGEASGSKVDSKEATGNKVDFEEATGNKVDFKEAAGNMVAEVNSDYSRKNIVKTEMSGNVGIHITLIGEVDSELFRRISRKPKVGDSIVIYGYAGELGANILMDERESELTDRFAEFYLRESRMDYGNLDIRKPVSLFISAGAEFIHDVSYGGIYRSLYEMSEYAGHGIEILHEKIPVKQSTIEVCEMLGINPYRLLGMGSFVAAVPSEKLESFEQSLTEQGISYSVAGTFTEKKERVISSKSYEMKRALTLYDKDELFK